MKNDKGTAVELTYKTEYIIKTFARAYKKDYENYVINRIWHKLDRLDVKFVTQQYVKRPGKKHALVDLYLPQLNMFIEVDEIQHREESNLYNDKVREVDIRNKIKGRDVITPTKAHSFHRISIWEESGDIDVIDIEKINKQCDKLVSEEIRRRIKKLELSHNFKPWDNEEEDPQKYIKKGQIALSDNVAFRNCEDVASCFGHNGKSFRSGITKHPFKNDTLIWFPKLYDHRGWKSEISKDGRIIRQSNIDKAKHYKDWLTDPWKIRIVFAHEEDALGIVRYRFKGVFKLDDKASKKEQRAVWEKKSNVVETEKARKPPVRRGNRTSDI